jgi:hypothetical protein
MACLVLAKERLRGWLHRNFSFGRCLYTDSRVWLTEGREVHSCGCGNVLSSRVPTAPGMDVQGPGWLHSGGDGRTGMEVTGETRSSGLMSPRCPAWAWGRCPYPFEGSAVLLRGCDAPAVRERVTQCHGVDTGLRLVALGTGRGMGHRAAVHLWHFVRRTSMRYGAWDVSFASRMRQIECTPGRALRPCLGPTVSSGCCSAPSQRMRDNGGEAGKRRWRRVTGEVEGTQRDKTEEDRPPLRWPTSRPPQMGTRSGTGLEVGSLDPPALEPLAPAIDGPALDLPFWGSLPPGPLDSPA